MEYCLEILKRKIDDYLNGIIDEYSDAIVHLFRKFRALFSGKVVHTFPELSAVI